MAYAVRLRRTEATYAISVRPRDLVAMKSADRSAGGSTMSEALMKIEGVSRVEYARGQDAAVLVTVSTTFDLPKFREGLIAVVDRHIERCNLANPTAKKSDQPEVTFGITM